VKQPDPLQHILRHTQRCNPSAPLGPQRMRAHTYGEFVYFHPFVQRFLYQRSAPDTEAADTHGAFALFQRNDLTRANVEIPHFDDDNTIKGGYRFELAIDRLNLYVFDCGVALLAIEFAALDVIDIAKDTTAALPPPRALTVADVLTLQNALRRCYTPYWKKEKDSERWHPSEVPSRLELHDGKGGGALNMSFDHRSAADEFDRIEKSDGAKRSAPFFSLWRDLLPLKLYGEKYAGRAGHAEWRHVVDERIPSLTYVATVESPKLMRRGDHARLCFMDTPGDWPYAYHESILQRFEDDHCYDRFWGMGTRQMFSGFSYVVIAEAGDFANDTLVHHFRRHYFQIAMLSHMEAAALLTYSGWISEALVKQARNLGTSFAADVLRIKEELLTFVHQYRFTGLSNQMQPQEMQAYWRRHLKLDALFDDVATEIETARDYLAAKESRDQTQASTNITLIAGLAAVIGLPMAFLGTNFIEYEKAFGFIIPNADVQWGVLFLAITAASILGLVVLRLQSEATATTTHRWKRWLADASTMLNSRLAQTSGGSRRSTTQRLKTLLWNTLIASAMLGIGFLVAG
jgi:hypothetical protein